MGQADHRANVVVVCGRALVQPAAHLVGDLCFMLGLIGLLETGWDHFSNVTGISLFWLTVNPLSNLIHLLAGLVGIGMSVSPRGSRRFLLLAGPLALGIGLAGFALDGSMSDYLATNAAMNWLHVAMGAAALCVGLAARGQLSPEWDLGAARRYLPTIPIVPERIRDEDERIEAPASR